MRIQKKKRSNGESDYYLLEGEYQDEQIVCSYGKEKPTFTYPDLRNGLAENELSHISDGANTQDISGVF